MKCRPPAPTTTSLLCRSAAAAPKKITTNPGSDGTPLYSPDGKYIAYRAQLRGGYESDRFRLMLYERATGKITDLSPNFDRWVDSMAWSPDSKTIYFTAENEGEAPIYAINVTAPNPWPQELVGGFNDSPTPTPDGKTLVFDRMSVLAPNEIYSCAFGYSRQCRIAVPPNRIQRPRLPALQGAAGHHTERSRAVPDRDAAAGILLVHRRGQRKSAGLPGQAAEFRSPTRSIRSSSSSMAARKARGATTGPIAGIPSCSRPTATSRS